MDLLGEVTAEIQAMLDLGARRQRVIAANIANVNTPGYRAKDLRFDEHLKRAVIAERKGVAPREDGNTVVMEVESAEMRKNALAYRIYLASLQHQVRMARMAITGRPQ
jgi:flagellar basal-body rod protein FlgB